MHVRRLILILTTIAALVAITGCTALPLSEIRVARLGEPGAPGLAVLAAEYEQANRATPRNVVVMLADDMGVASLHAEHPGSGLPTPALDTLHAQGMSFTDAHSPSAVCSPTRYGLLTGRYPWRTDMKAGIVPKWGPPLIADDTRTLADVARAAGLRTACIGKWHLGWRWPAAGGGFTRKPADIDWSEQLGGGPLAAGFDTYFGDDVPNWPPYVWIKDDRMLGVPTEIMLEDDANGVRHGPAMANWSLEAVLPELTRRCVSFIETSAEANEPFLLFFSMTSPHTPINPSEAFAGRSGVNRYADFLLETDWSVEQVLLALDRAGVANNTLVIFTTDNGTSPKCDFEALAKSGVDLRGPWRGMKGDAFEGGHRVPLLVRWPGVTEAGSSCAEPVGLTDIMATVADALDEPLGDADAPDSVSLRACLQGDAPDTPLHAPLVSQSSRGRFALRHGRWKLICAGGSAGWTPPTSEPAARKAGLPALQLYDLKVDPGETNNLVHAQPKQVRRMLDVFKAKVAAAPNDGPAHWSQLPWSADGTYVKP